MQATPQERVREDLDAERRQPATAATSWEGAEEDNGGSLIGHVPTGSQTWPHQIWLMGSGSEYHAPANTGKQDTHGVLCNQSQPGALRQEGQVFLRNADCPEARVLPA